MVNSEGASSIVAERSKDMAPFVNLEDAEDTIEFTCKYPETFIKVQWTIQPSEQGKNPNLRHSMSSSVANSEDLKIAGVSINEFI
mmetsp:Transcript_9656/g.16224  ORF Transcript_9656/g.16224 Transcript_9656/m.16224 type:complete len:85 (+) Transcript_9656:291-545(+)